MALHYDECGEGPAAVFVHGSFGWGMDTFPHQCALADTHRVVLVDRHGFGGTPDSGHAVLGWPVDAEAVIDLVDAFGGAHLVGQSYGAVVALLVASRRPDLVRSLVVIEPPLFDLAPGDPDAQRVHSRARPVFTEAPGLSAREFTHAWLQAVLGLDEAQRLAWTDPWSAQDWSAADATRREAWPGDAPIDTGVLRSLGVPKVMVTGAWATGGGDGPSPTGAAFRAVATTIAQSIDAPLVEFARSTHNPQLQEPEEFNALLRRTWAAAEA